MGFIKGRNLKDNVRKAMNIKEKEQTETVPRTLLFLDAKKTFDRIHWQYLFYMMKIFGVGKSFSQWLHLAYEDQISILELEGHQSDRMQVK